MLWRHLNWMSRSVCLGRQPAGPHLKQCSGEAACSLCPTGCPLLLCQPFPRDAEVSVLCAVSQRSGNDACETEILRKKIPWKLWRCLYPKPGAFLYKFPSESWKTSCKWVMGRYVRGWCWAAGWVSRGFFIWDQPRKSGEAKWCSSALRCLNRCSFWINWSKPYRVNAERMRLQGGSDAFPLALAFLWDFQDFGWNGYVSVSYKSNGFPFFWCSLITYTQFQVFTVCVLSQQLLLSELRNARLELALWKRQVVLDVNGRGSSRFHRDAGGCYIKLLIVIFLLKKETPPRILVHFMYMKHT